MRIAWEMLYAKLRIGRYVRPVGRPILPHTPTSLLYLPAHPAQHQTYQLIT